MKLKNLNIVLLLIFISSVGYAQPLYFGVKLDAFALHTEKLKTVKDYKNEYTFYFPKAGYLFLKGTLNKNAKIDLTLKLGYLDANDYSGFELGMFLQKYFLDKIYLSLGFNIHFNRSKIIKNDINLSKPINFLGGGVGLDLTEHFFAELNFDYALNNEYGGTTFYEQNYPKKPKNIYSIIRFGLGYKF